VRSILRRYSDSDSDSPTSIPRTWPFTAARSTASGCSDLLTALLAADAFDEISDRYITHRGLLDDGGRTRKGMVFWFYPTGLYGPYRYLESGAVVVRHVTLALVTIEPGVDAKEFMNEFKDQFTKDDVDYGAQDGIMHEHFAALK
ncbi:hypothetical protein M405DRAFT_830629, partial [Rhizopogon salebrosus TDB-379]